MQIKDDLTFLNSSKYKEFHLKKQKLLHALLQMAYQNFFLDNCIKLNVKNVLFAVTQVSKNVLSQSRY